jgi:hypothetical protein
MLKRWRGLKSMVQDGVEHGSRAVERVQIRMAKIPFDLLERVPVVKVPASGVRLVYNTAVSGTHEVIRLVNKVVGDTIDVALDQVEPPEASAQVEARSGSAPPETPRS